MESGQSEMTNPCCLTSYDCRSAVSFETAIPEFDPSAEMNVGIWEKKQVQEKLGS